MILSAISNKFIGAGIGAYLLAALLAFILPIQSILIAVFILIVLDTITGVWAAHVKKEDITSTKLKRSLTKILVYNSSLLIGNLLEIYLVPFIPVVKIIAAIIGVVEGLSLFENLYYIYPNKVIRLVIEALRKQETKLEDNIKQTGTI